MAIDSENKRRSVSGYTGRVVLPSSDGRISAADRAHAAGFYAGFFSNIGVLSFGTENMALSTFENEEIALSSFSGGQMALSTLSDEGLENG